MVTDCATDTERGKEAVDVALEELQPPGEFDRTRNNSANDKAAKVYRSDGKTLCSGVERDESSDGWYGHIFLSNY